MRTAGCPNSWPWTTPFSLSRQFPESPTGRLSILTQSSHRLTVSRSSTSGNRGSRTCSFAPELPPSFHTAAFGTMASDPTTTPSSNDIKKDRPSFAKVCRDPLSPSLSERQQQKEQGEGQIQQKTQHQQQTGRELTPEKIAAAGIKPPNAQQNSNTHSNSNQKHDIPSSPRDGTTVVTPSSVSPQQNPSLQQKTLATPAANAPASVESDTGGPEVRVQIVESVPRRTDENAPDGLLAPAPSTDDAVTQMSSSSDSNKPQSLDGKSVASGTTFALDEKDSLRPDDSASVKAGDEDDMFSPGSGLPGSRIGSDDGVRAFRDQLREISSMEPQRRGGPPPVFGNAQKGVLYVPPQGPGIGAVPNATRSQPPNPAGIDVPPDQKLLEALENPRDRVWVLKLEQDVIDFVKDPKEVSLTLPQCHSFYRLLAHKMADYYMLGHLVDDTSAAVKLFKTPNCRIPPPLTGITAPSTAASTPPPSAPQMKILRRGIDKSGPALANGSAKDGSENGDSGEDDKKAKAPVSREEREARYEAARLRIMGSAKPTESPEAPKEKQDSRSSSTTGKKSKKKQRADSDDGFEARSAYSNYFTNSFGSDQQPAAAYGYPEFSTAATNQLAAVYGQPNQTSGMSHMTPTSAQAPWNQSYQTMDPTQAWAHGQSGTYDLSADFQRMSFQNQVPAQNATQWNGNFGQQYYSQQSWPQQQYQTPSQMSTQGGYGYNAQAYAPSTSSHPHHDQTYAYGQLPSQAFPGRPPTNNEHPLPGSYKGKHFNPQSQSFIPNQANSGPFTPPTAPIGNYGSGFASPAQLQRQGSSQSHGSAFGGSPHHTPPHAISNRTTNAPMTHPLPQGPVFPRQPSPNVPLPPKPTAASQRQNEYQQFSSAAQNPQSAQQNQSLLAKWGAPASLPAKPPPPSTLDGLGSAQTPRQTYANPTAAARQPGGSGSSGGYPTFGSMPPSGSAQIVNGSSGYGGKRT